MDPLKEFEAQVEKNIESLKEDVDLQGLSRVWLRESINHKYAYNFRWLGRPIIQEPQDIVAIQELIWKEKPDLIIETGIAHGGSLILSASVLALLDYGKGDTGREVVGIDIDIRKHNRDEIEKHPLSTKIKLIEGNSIDERIINTVHYIARNHSRIMVFMDSYHTHAHVLAELNAYAPLVSTGSYCVVFDTGVEDLPSYYCSDREWGKGNNPKTAVMEFLKSHDEFEIDKSMDYKLLISAAQDGYLRRIK